MVVTKVCFGHEGEPRIFPLELSSKNIFSIKLEKNQSKKKNTHVLKKKNQNHNKKSEFKQRTIMHDKQDHISGLPAS